MRVLGAAALRDGALSVEHVHVDEGGSAAVRQPPIDVRSALISGKEADIVGGLIRANCRPEQVRKVPTRSRT